MAERSLLRAMDGHEIAVTHFPASGKPWGSVVFAGAMGARQDFYAPLAGHLAEAGLDCFTFDYRGTGFSLRGSMRDVDATIDDWAAKDYDAVLGLARKQAPDAPLFVVGHSLGGQVLAMASNAPQVRAMLSVTAGNGWYGLNDRMPLRVRFFWFIAVPLLTPIFGFFPGRRLGMVGDLPAGVARQWRSWCTHRGYLHSEGEGVRSAMASLALPIRCYSFEDDEIITRKAVDELQTYYRSANVERHHVAPAEVGATRIGHFGYFNKRNRDTLWKDSLEWLRTKA